MVQVLDSGVLIHKRGGPIKALARGNGLIEGYLISFGSPQDADLEGQWFTPNTDIKETFFKDYPILFHHGMDKTVGLDPIGRITRLNKDNVGWHVQAFLDLTDSYGREVYGMLQTDPFGWSSGSVDHLVVILQSGEIVVWPLYEGSVTPSPMQPHKTTVRALKSLGIYPRLRGPSITAKAGFSGAGFASEGDQIMATNTKARPSTQKYVTSVLKSNGLKATPAMIAAIAAQCDADDAAQMAADDEDDATMGFGDDQDMGGNDPSTMDFPEDNDPSNGMMDFPEDDTDPSQMGFGDDEEDPTQMGFGDEEDDQQPPPMTASVRKGNGGQKLAKRAPKTSLTSKKGGFTTAQMQQINALQRQVQSLTRSMKALEMEEAPGERYVGVKGGKNFGDVRVTRDEADQPFAYTKAFVSYVTQPGWMLDDRTKSILRKGQVDYGAADSVKSTNGVKALNTSNAGSIGFAVPDDFVDELNRNIMVQALTAAECKSRTTTSDTILIPDLPTTDARRAFNGRATWIGETAANQAESDVTPIALGQINLPIHVLLVSTVSSLSAMEDAAFDLQAYITEAFSEMITIEYEELIMLGSGQGKMLGILSDARVTGAASTGVSSVSGYIASGAASTVADADKIIDMYMHLPPQYKGTAKWYMNSNTARQIMKLKDGIGNYLWGNEHYGLNTGMPKALLERPIILNEWMPDIAAGAFPIVVGDLSRGYTIGKRVEFSVRRFDDSQYASQDQCLILGRARLGGQPTLPVAMKVLKTAVS